MTNRYLNIKELSEYIGVKTNTLYAWVSMQRIPHLKFGSLVRFDKEEIDKWIDKSRVKPHKVWKN